MLKTVERAAVRFTSLPAFFASASRSRRVASWEVDVAAETSDLILEASPRFTGGLEPTWARALAREKGYVTVEAMALLTAAIRNVSLAPGSSRLDRGKRVRLKVS